MGLSLPAYLMQLILRRPYGVHSPFLYDLAEKCLYADFDDPVFEKLEQIRMKLKRSKELIRVTDYGAGSRSARTVASRTNFSLTEPVARSRPAASPMPFATATPSMHMRRVGRMARKVLQKPRYCRLLYRLSAYLNPDRILEFGTSFGIAASYLASGSPSARMVTMEGCPETSRVARDVFVQAGTDHIELLNGPFRDVLPGLVKEGFTPDVVYIDGNHTYGGLWENYSAIREHIPPDGVLIMDDIRWSAGMWKAWKEIIHGDDVRLSVDLGKLGLLFFRPALSKENVILGF